MIKMKFVLLLIAIMANVSAYANQGQENSSSPQVSSRVKANLEGTKAFVNTVGQKIIAIIKASQNGQINKDDDFRALLRTHFDLPKIGRFALGRYWNIASFSQQQEYLKLFESIVVKTYASQFDEYTNENLKVTDARSDSGHGVTVFSRVIRPGHPPLKVNWVISVDHNGAMKVEDLIVNGVSMRITQRSEYMAVIQKNQGKVSGLITEMKAQIARLNSESF